MKCKLEMEEAQTKDGSKMLIGFEVAPESNIWNGMLSGQLLGKGNQIKIIKFVLNTKKLNIL